MKVRKHGPASTSGPSVFTFPALKKSVLNANIINSHPVTEMTVIKSSLSRLHYANKFTFTVEGWNIPHLHRWRVFKNGQKQPWQLNNHEDFSQSRSVWRLLFFFSFFNTLRQTDNFLNPLRCRPCSLLQGWPPSAGGFDIPKGTTEDLYDIHPTAVYITYGPKIRVFTTPFLKAWDVIASHFLGSLPPAGHYRADQ